MRAPCRSVLSHLVSLHRPEKSPCVPKWLCINSPHLTSIIYPTVVAGQFPHSPQRGTIHAPFTALPLLSGLRADFLGGTVPQECQLQAGPRCRYVSSRLTCLDDTVPIVFTALPAEWDCCLPACLPCCPRRFAPDAIPTRIVSSLEVCPGDYYLDKAQQGVLYVEQTTNKGAWSEAQGAGASATFVCSWSSYLELDASLQRDHSLKVVNKRHLNEKEAYIVHLGCDICQHAQGALEEDHASGAQAESE